MAGPPHTNRIYKVAGRVAVLAVLVGLLLCLVLLNRLGSIGKLPGDLSHHPALRVSQPFDESNVFFDAPEIVQIVLELEEANAEKLRVDARGYVQCQLIENGGEPLSVGIKLKGAAGSFRELDDRPAFTVNVKKYRKQQRFHRLEKFYLNNSVQDEAYYSEWLCASICQQMHLPAPRISFAHVWLNDRDLGLYVFKEGFDEAFLARHFREAGGSLYDGGFLQDIDVDLEKDSGRPLDDLSDLQRLRNVCLETDLQQQRNGLEKTLDIDAFLSFMAFEMMTAHWDGYVAQKNNYRLYFPPVGRAWFLPHGMDQTFQETEFSLFEPRDSLASRAVRSQVDWNEHFRQRVRQHLPLFEPQRLIRSLELLEARLRPELIKLDPDCAPVREDLLAQWRERLKRRYASIVEQLEQPDPPPHVYEVPPVEDSYLQEGETIALSDWTPRQETPDSQLAASDEESLVYRIEAGDSGDCIASWRRSVPLSPGSYRFSAQLRGEGIVPRAGDERGFGAGLRISGANRSNGLDRIFDWQEVAYDFTIDPQVHPLEPSSGTEAEPTATDELSQIELVSELRATTGWCEMRSPTLTRSAK